MIYLLELHPYDPVGENTVTLRFCSGGAPITDDGHVYRPRVAQPFQFSQTVFAGEFGRALPQVGQIVLHNADGRLDHLTGYRWDDRLITVKRGPLGGPYSTYAVVRGAAVAWTDQHITITLADLGAKLYRTLHNNTYAGTGDREGPADLKGRHKPLLFGRCLNVTPIEINTALLVYQVHDGEIDAIEGVFDRGVELTGGSDHADYATLAAATVAAGTFDTCLAEGLFRLGAPPDGPLTVDVRGEAGGGYVNTTADIIERLAVDRLGLDAGDLDAPAFSQLNSDQGAAVGIYLPDATDAASVLDALMAGIGGWWWVSLTGKLTVKRLALGTPVGTLNFGRATLVRREEPPLPSWRRRVGWQKNWTPMTRGDINLPSAFEGMGDLATQDSVDWGSQVDGPGKPADGATVGAPNGTYVDGVPAADIASQSGMLFRETFDRYTDQASVLENWESLSGGGEITVLSGSGASAGGKVINIGNNSGNDMRQLLSKTRIPFDEAKLYRIRARLARLNGSGTIYVGVMGFAYDKTTIVSPAGDTTAPYYYIAAAGYSPGDTGYVNLTGYLKGHANPGTSSPRPDPTDPAKVHPDVRYISFFVIVNYSGAPGTTRLDELTIEAISSDLAAHDLVTTPTVAQGAVTAAYKSEKTSAQTMSLNTSWQTITSLSVTINAAADDKIDIQVGLDFISISRDDRGYKFGMRLLKDGAPLSTRTGWAGEAESDRTTTPTSHYFNGSVSFIVDGDGASHTYTVQIQFMANEQFRLTYPDALYCAGGFMRALHLKKAA